MMLQRWRRLVQVSVLSLIFFIAFANLFSAVYMSPGTYPRLYGQMIGGRAEDIQPTSMPSARAVYPEYRAVFLLIEKFISVFSIDEPEKVLGLFKGGSWSLVFLGAEFSDPLAFASSFLASRHLEAGLAISIAVPVLLGILMGPVWCSWLCPINTLGEIADRLRGSLSRRISLPGLRLDKNTKYVILGSGLLGSALFGFNIFPYLLPYVALTQEVYRAVFFQALGPGLALVSAVLAADVLLWRRGFCRYLCPTRALLSLLGRRRLVHVEKVGGRCNGCGLCAEVCPMGIHPFKNVSPGCTSCGLCVKACGRKALELNLSLPRGRISSTITGTRQK